MHYWPLEGYIYGATAGLILLALFSDCVYKPFMLWLPIFSSTIVLLIYFIGVYLYDNLIDEI